MQSQAMEKSEEAEEKSAVSEMEPTSEETLDEDSSGGIYWEE